MKITGDATCPGCGKDHPVAIDIDKLEIKQPDISLKNVNTATEQTTVQVEPIKEPEPKLVRIPAKDEPFYECKDCNKPHENKHYTERPNQKCTNCDSLNGSSRKACKTCGNKEFEELDEDKLNDLGIPIPPEPDHTHQED